MILISDEKIIIPVKDQSAKEYLTNLKDAIKHLLRFQMVDGPSDRNPDPDGLNAYLLDFLMEDVKLEEKRNMEVETKKHSYNELYFSEDGYTWVKKPTENTNYSFIAHKSIDGSFSDSMIELKVIKPGYFVRHDLLDSSNQLKVEFKDADEVQIDLRMCFNHGMKEEVNPAIERGEEEFKAGKGRGFKEFVFKHICNDMEIEILAKDLTHATLILKERVSYVEDFYYPKDKNVVLKND